MNGIPEVRVSIIGLELEQEVDQERVIFDFCIKEEVVNSYFLKDGELTHVVNFNDDFEYIKVLVRSVDDKNPFGEVRLTFSFLNECEKDSRNEQWLPLSSEGEEYLVSKDFNAYNCEAPCIMLRFEPLIPYPMSPPRKYEEITIEKPVIRSPYNSGAESKPVRQLSTDRQKSGTNLSHKTASLRRRDNLPMQISNSRAQAINR